MKLPTFFSSTPKKAGAPLTTAELAAKLAEAEEAHSAALARVNEARAALATDRNESALQAHREATSAAADLAVMVDIVRDEHTAAAARGAAEERARLEAQVAELETQLTRDNVLSVTREAAEREAKLLLQLAECRAGRRQLRDGLKSKEHERHRLLHQLGRPELPQAGQFTAADEAISYVAVVDLLDKQSASGLVRHFLNDLKPAPSAYWPDRFSHATAT